ncbi:MAG: response regulator transcription factor [Mycobacterium sp.]|nr:response regulator transcription factor [Mycobacterium sp.]
MSGIRVVVIDPHESVRAGLQVWFAQADPPFEAVADFATPADYLGWLPAHAPPDCVVAEIRPSAAHAPDFDVLRQMCGGQASVIVHSAMLSQTIVLAALDAGAATCLDKARGREPLLAALHRVCRAGARYRSPQMTETISHREEFGTVNLSSREREALLTWFRHDSKKTVAEMLYISPATVRTHLQRIRSKYALAGRPAPTKSALLARAIEDGLVGVAEFAEFQADGQGLVRAV